ncbi:argonaute/piwi family protein [Sedimenticola selenatireducens]|uniref:argonaute/piwi family protein n=1 Tax=Sedimenticola selenatireducens TaxID=191960 RepID=UPI00048E556B|nr:hypothetical protein [Sedimenticola selenatireducens]
MNPSNQLIYIDEPELCFGFEQHLDFSKDGLMLFGPLDGPERPVGIRVGVVGSPKGIERYKRWVKHINGYIPAGDETAAHHTAFPGFETVFGAKWPTEPVCEISIPEIKILNSIRIKDRHQAIYNTVSLFDAEIRRHIVEEEAQVEVWFVVIPEEVHKYGRPKSKVPNDIAQSSPILMTAKQARVLDSQQSLFKEDHENAEVYKYELNFHNQLKARLLDSKQVLQVVRETTLAPDDFMEGGRQSRRLQDPASVAWNLCTTAYFKSSGRPWKLAQVRERVCYVGLVFKQDMTSKDPANACCGAQMFLDSGDGLVFKGAMGPWYSEATGEYHLKFDDAKKLSEKIVSAYERLHGYPPSELFVHGKTRINQEEWEGFQAGVPAETNIVSIRIRKENQFKLYSSGTRPVARGMALLVTKRRGYLWTKGYIPRLKTYPGREVPNPLNIEICYGDADLAQVMEDIISLTKINFNACIYADGEPVTLRFADQVGEILTATPMAHELPPLPFKHYI